MPASAHEEGLFDLEPSWDIHSSRRESHSSRSLRGASSSWPWRQPLLLGLTVAGGALVCVVGTSWKRTASHRRVLTDDGYVQATIALARSPERCWTASASQALVAIPNSTTTSVVWTQLRLGDCIANPDRFLIPAYGVGPIRWASHPYLCLDVPDQSAKLQLWRCDESPLSHLEFVLPAGDRGPIRFKSAQDRCLDVPGPLDSNNVLQVWTCGWGHAQDQDFIVQRLEREEPVDCEWSQWSQWSSCPIGCALVDQTRSRRVAQHSSLGGQRCVGASSDARPCCIRGPSASVQHKQHRDSLRLLEGNGTNVQKDRLQKELAMLRTAARSTAVVIFSTVLLGLTCSVCVFLYRLLPSPSSRSTESQEMEESDEGQPSAPPEEEEEERDEAEIQKARKFAVAARIAVAVKKAAKLSFHRSAAKRAGDDADEVMSKCMSELMSDVDDADDEAAQARRENRRMAAALKKANDEADERERLAREHAKARREARLNAMLNATGEAHGKEGIFISADGLDVVIDKSDRGIEGGLKRARCRDGEGKWLKTGETWCLQQGGSEAAPAEGLGGAAEPLSP